MNYKVVDMNYIGVPEAAERMEVSTWSVSNFCRDGAFPGAKMAPSGRGGTDYWWIPSGEVDDLIVERQSQRDNMPRPRGFAAGDHDKIEMVHDPSSTFPVGGRFPAIAWLNDLGHGIWPDGSTWIGIGGKMDDQAYRVNKGRIEKVENNGHLRLQCVRRALAEAELSLQQEG